MLFGEGAQLRQLLLGLRAGALGQIAQEADHLLRALRHFGRQRLVGVGIEAQQLSQLVAQRQRFRHHFAVVPFTGVRPLIGGAGGEARYISSRSARLSA